MHDGCSGRFDNGKQVVDKIRMMGFNVMPMEPVEKYCSNCEESFTMQTYEGVCPGCGMTYGVTPCHSHDPESIMPAGIDY
ncbi:hypothetical protein [Limisalsivibrio acetivorans]|uniref:hypothetical protein n=1 Tax=Limisalsivibrio acetivorans TaxID=1304888 RepID=UPI0003B6BA04|nr:hypothetical protein [Limisalsivibrio acetivorans]